MMNVLGSQSGTFEHDLDKSTLEQLLDEQLCRELSGRTLIKSVEAKKEENEENTEAKELFIEWRSKWREAFIQSIATEMEGIKAGRSK